MSLFGIDVFVHAARHNSFEEQVMAKLNEVQDAVAAQAGLIADLKADAAAARLAIEAEIVRVEALIAAGAGAATEADLQGLLDGLTAANLGLASADVDLEAAKSEADAERP